MSVAFTTPFQQTVAAILQEEKFVYRSGVEIERPDHITIRMQFETDEWYAEIRSWCMAALGCGLINAPHMER